MTTTTVGKVERAMRATLSYTDTRRVEAYLTLSEAMDEVAVKSDATRKALEAVLSDPATTDADKERARESFEEVHNVARDVLDKMEDEGFERQLPTPEMLRAYALIEIARAIDGLRADVAEIKEGIELG